MVDERSTSTVPAGWYNDGTGTGTIRWWDGSAWTNNVQPAPDAPTPRPSTPHGFGFAVIDFETTGLFPGGHDRVAEVAVVHVAPDGTIEGRWDTLINPERDLGPQHIHEIQARDVLSAPTFRDAAPELIALLSGRVLVAHNANFDTRFLDAELTRLEYDPGVTISAICTMVLATDIIPGAGRSLADCCDHFDIDLTGAHRASVDALATASLLSAYMQATPDWALWADAVGKAATAPWQPMAPSGVPWKPRPEADAPSIHFLERISNRLPAHDGPVDETTYLALLDRCLLDRLISEHESEDLVRAAVQLGLGRDDCERLNLHYFSSLAQVAWADSVITAEESADLQAVAHLLHLPDSVLDDALCAPQIATAPGPAATGTINAEGFHLLAGDVIVLTGDMRRSREAWTIDLQARGYIAGGCISKKVKLVAAADPDSLSGKARKARDYGITIVSEEGLARLLG
ncbi:DUF2510 domain-containing protein [Cryobacterium algoricola]|uniref:DUF2510 domain-containing protein n=1 Tax=Cryobacterium algoricola TaxID=1259183 RepID=A0ABY2IC18_9MICO|nr:exonuclease domain-containing protein [Cryobacterium algoricola]TFB84113.1 DUF2510 domain-containing protein [Cryobacterium algoricola]